MKKRTRLLPEQKRELLESMAIANCSVPQFAKLHGISKSLLYKWSREKGLGNSRQNQSGILNNNFALLSVANEPAVSKFDLQKASLTFSNFSLLLEGAISSRALISILKMLEE
jgi:transposase-like protein